MADVELNPDESSELQVLRRVVEACERFQADWRTDHSRRIDAYVYGFEHSHLDRLVRGLMASEFALCRENGENPSREQYLARYPEWPEAVDAIFKSAERASVYTRALADRPVDARRSGCTTEIEPIGSITVGRADITTDFQSGPPAPGAVEEPLPERFGRYAVTGVLGKGGFGTVYLAWDEELGRKVAIKVPRPGLLGSAEQVESFIAEGRITAALGHRAIVAVHDIGRHGENSVFVVFEYIEGRSLAEVLDAEPISAARLVRLMVAVAEAAHCAHAAGLVHRDLKPSNILIDQKDRPHIADFGLAIREELQRDRIGEIAGTPPYMAPEQVRGETHRLDGRTDVWAIGVMLYQGLAVPAAVFGAEPQ